ncbi:MAG: succinate dehydrogenase assembly factor 4 [Cycloclasticus sp.]
MNDKVDKVEPSDKEGANKEIDKALEETKEINGRKGLDPTRYGDWEKNGRCIDF